MPISLSKRGRREYSNLDHIQRNYNETIAGVQPITHKKLLCSTDRLYANIRNLLLYRQPLPKFIEERRGCGLDYPP